MTEQTTHSDAYADNRPTLSQPVDHAILGGWRIEEFDDDVRVGKNGGGSLHLELLGHDLMVVTSDRTITSLAYRYYSVPTAEERAVVGDLLLNAINDLMAKAR